MLMQNQAKAKHVDLGTLKLLPVNFTAYLKQECGFRLLEQRVPKTTKAGFDRPLFLFKKVA